MGQCFEVLILIQSVISWEEPSIGSDLRDGSKKYANPVQQLFNYAKKSLLLITCFVCLRLTVSRPSIEY